MQFWAVVYSLQKLLEIWQIFFLLILLSIKNLFFFRFLQSRKSTDLVWNTGTCLLNEHFGNLQISYGIQVPAFLMSILVRKVIVWLVSFRNDVATYNSRIKVISFKFCLFSDVCFCWFLKVSMIKKKYFFAETESLWFQGLVILDFWK